MTVEQAKKAADRRRACELRGRLLARRHRLLAQMSRADELPTTAAETGPRDEAEQTLDALNEEMDLRVKGIRAGKVQQVEEALQKISDGTYGRCEVCGCRIPAARLELMPEATTCVACQKDVERARDEDDAAADWEGVDRSPSDEPSRAVIVKGLAGSKL